MKPAARLTVDFETRSAADLKKLGAQAYAMHPSTQVLCLGWHLTDECRGVWRPGMPDPTPALEHVAAGGTVVIHNVPFEIAIWEHVIPRHAPHWPQLAIEQCDDTMVRALVLSLPGKLEEVARVLRLPVQKDMDGNKLMRKLMKPRKPKKGEAPPAPGTYLWHDDPADLERVMQYCATDVDAERLLDDKLPPLTAAERELWILDQRINRRGMKLDLEHARTARAVCDTITERLNEEVRQITGGAVERLTQTARMQTWLKGQGLAMSTFRKNDVRAVTQLSPELLYSDDVVRLLNVRLEAGKASTKKLGAMLACAGPDGRARNQFAHHGATTGRAAGRLIQLHNLPRPELKDKDILGVLKLLDHPNAADAIELCYGPPVDVLKSCLRALLTVEPGNELVGGDFANIEGRTLAWLAGEEWKLEAFRAYDKIIPGKLTSKGEPLRAGPDLYVLAYARAFNLPVEAVTDAMRQIGKVMELSLGYQGGVGAFKSMGANYGVAIVAEGERPPPGSKQVLFEDQADEIKKAWRRAHPAVVFLWRELEQAAMNATLNPGRVVAVAGGRVKYQRAGAFLFCRLPSGRKLAYPKPFVTNKKREFIDRKTGETVEKISPALCCEGKIDGGQWGVVDLYGGLHCENIVQAIARDLLYGAIRRLEAAGLPVVLHVHDDARAEVPAGSVSLECVASLMTDSEPWAAGLPVAVAASRGARFGK